MVIGWILGSRAAQDAFAMEQKRRLDREARHQAAEKTARSSVRRKDYRVVRSSRVLTVTDAFVLLLSIGVVTALGRVVGLGVLVFGMRRFVRHGLQLRLDRPSRDDPVGDGLGRPDLAGWPMVPRPAHCPSGS